MCGKMGKIPQSVDSKRQNEVSRVLGLGNFVLIHLQCFYQYI